MKGCPRNEESSFECATLLITLEVRERVRVNFFDRILCVLREEETGVFRYLYKFFRLPSCLRRIAFPLAGTYQPVASRTLSMAAFPAAGRDGGTDDRFDESLLMVYRSKQRVVCIGHARGQTERRSRNNVYRTKRTDLIWTNLAVDADSSSSSCLRRSAIELAPIHDAPPTDRSIIPFYSAKA